MVSAPHLGACPCGGEGGGKVLDFDKSFLVLEFLRSEFDSINMSNSLSLNN